MTLTNPATAPAHRDGIDVANVHLGIRHLEQQLVLFDKIPQLRLVGFEYDRRRRAVSHQFDNAAPVAIDARRNQISIPGLHARECPGRE